MSIPEFDLGLCLAATHPDESWSLLGNEYDGLLWRADTPKPTLAALEAAWPDVAYEAGWRKVREVRAELLAACDWTQMPDVPLDATQRQAWAVYRQALRDVPEAFDTPYEVVWPTQPA